MQTALLLTGGGWVYACSPGAASAGVASRHVAGWLGCLALACSPAAVGQQPAGAPKCAASQHMAQCTPDRRRAPAMPRPAPCRPTATRMPWSLPLLWEGSCGIRPARCAGCFVCSLLAAAAFVLSPHASCSWHGGARCGRHWVACLLEGGADAFDQTAPCTPGPSYCASPAAVPPCPCPAQLTSVPLLRPCAGLHGGTPAALHAHAALCAVWRLGRWATGCQPGCLLLGGDSRQPLPAPPRTCAAPSCASQQPAAHPSHPAACPHARAPACSLCGGAAPERVARDTGGDPHLCALRSV